MTRDLDLEAALVLRKLVDGLVREAWEQKAPLIKLANERLAAGRREQEGSTTDWSGWDGETFRRNVDEEIADGFNYVRQALRRGYRL